jgi:hypothetical protein
MTAAKGPNRSELPVLIVNTIAEAVFVRAGDFVRRATDGTLWAQSKAKLEQSANYRHGSGER